MMRTIALTLLLAASAIACDKTPAPTAEPVATAASQRAAAPVDAREQYQLAAEIAAAQRVDPEDDPAALDRVVRSWQGKRFRWQLAVVRSLCARADSCVVAPFDHARFDEPVVQGWMPRLELDQATHAELLRACRDREPCVLSVDARLRQLSLSSELPTSLTLDRVAIVAARAAKPAEAWVARR